MLTEITYRIGAGQYLPLHRDGREIVEQTDKHLMLWHLETQNALGSQVSVLDVQIIGQVIDCSEKLTNNIEELDRW